MSDAHPLITKCNQNRYLGHLHGLADTIANLLALPLARVVMLQEDKVAVPQDTPWESIARPLDCRIRKCRVAIVTRRVVQHRPFHELGPSVIAREWGVRQDLHPRMQQKPFIHTNNHGVAGREDSTEL